MVLHTITKFLRYCVNEKAGHKDGRKTQNIMPLAPLSMGGGITTVRPIKTNTE